MVGLFGRVSRIQNYEMKEPWLHEIVRTSAVNCLVF